ncbi:CU044_2847 family protein [Streptomyces sp. NPDC051016]|uniref:CU044_2847 family protein n=1 Tax=Streptomyces sp. NPDC051016 TaxID=3365638 RepID=UPI0037B5AE15
MTEFAGQEASAVKGAVERSRLIPLDVEGQTVYVAVQALELTATGPGVESEIASRRPTLEQALDGLMGLARAMGARLQESNASKVTVQFGCEFALESGTFVAVVGKASARSTFAVGLEWERP